MNVNVTMSRTKLGENFQGATELLGTLKMGTYFQTGYGLQSPGSKKGNSFPLSIIALFIQIPFEKSYHSHLVNSHVTKRMMWRLWRGGHRKKVRLYKKQEK